jgi:hypothetical protein
MPTKTRKRTSLELVPRDDRQLRALLLYLDTPDSLDYSDVIAAADALDVIGDGVFKAASRLARGGDDATKRKLWKTIIDHNLHPGPVRLNDVESSDVQEMMCALSYKATMIGAVMMYRLLKGGA